MGIVFPTIPLSVMGEATEGREAAELSSTILMDYLGVGIGAGLGGVCIALADAGTISLEAGLAGAFGLGVTFALVLALVGRRLPDAREVVAEDTSLRLTYDLPVQHPPPDRH